MIGVVMGEYQAVQSADAGCAQRRRQDAVAAVRTIAVIGAGIVEQCVMAGLSRDCQALAYIEDDQAQTVWCGWLRGVQEHR